MVIGSCSEVVLAVATIVLVLATWRLARHTKALSDLTDRLVSIEQERERQNDLRIRRAAILRCLDLTEELRKIVPAEFAGQLKQPGKIPEPISRYIRELALTKDKYINDPDTVQNLRSLRQTLDDVELGGSIGGNEQEIAKKFRSVQERIGWSITEWREELES